MAFKASSGPLVAARALRSGPRWRCVHRSEVPGLPAGSIVASGDVETVKEEILFGE